MCKRKSGDDAVRAFIAILLEPVIVEQIVRFQERLREMGVSGNFTACDNLHLTLAFLGEVHSQEAVVAMRMAEEKPFSIVLERGGCFAKRGGNIVWIGVRENDALMHLQAQLCKRLRFSGFHLEERPYVPHITLARKAKLPSGWNPDAVDWPVFTQTVGEMHLMESARINGRLRYTSIVQAPFSAE